MQLEIHFRRLTPKPKRFRSRVHWQVDCWEESQSFPIGQCWVYVPKFDAGHVLQLPPVVDFIQVLPPYRKKGVASQLLAACFERWPTLTLTKPISRGGAALVRKFGG